MAISKKYRRTIHYNGEDFLWWVDPEIDYQTADMLRVSIASKDKKFLIKHFALQHNPDEAYLTIIGEYFPGLEGTGNHRRLPCPSFKDSLRDNAVTPRTVKDILDWCFKKDGRTVDVKS